ncbi:MAG: aromatic ring-hydroxylating dioxygenase subunit alpha, partial [Pyrinomonadaceae bacterium]
MIRLTVDEDIKKARTLASDFYTAPAYFDASIEKIFSRSWQFLGDITEIDGLKPVTMLPETLSEPLLLS